MAFQLLRVYLVSRDIPSWVSLLLLQSQPSYLHPYIPHFGKSLEVYKVFFGWSSEVLHYLVCNPAQVDPYSQVSPTACPNPICFYP